MSDTDVEVLVDFGYGALLVKGCNYKATIFSCGSAHVHTEQGDVRLEPDEFKEVEVE